MSPTESPMCNTPPLGGTVHQLVIKAVFEALEPREKLYAHYLARAAWCGSRIIMRQVSPEGPGIFDFIMDLYHSCGGEWDTLIAQCNVTPDELTYFLEYASVFLSNLGNFYGEGDQRFVPGLTVEALQTIANISESTKNSLATVIDSMLAVPPSGLGYPSKNAQSGYYPGSELISKEEIAIVSEAMVKNSIGLENTRIRKLVQDGRSIFQLLQASAETETRTNNQQEFAEGIFLIRGDHCEELSKYASNSTQEDVLAHYLECFRTGSLKAFEESQKLWVTDVAARVENMIRFIEAYRDPAGIRSEWEAMIGIADPDETSRLKHFVGISTSIIRQLPWAVEGITDGKGPFEKSLLEAPDFTSVHALAVCGSVVFEAANLPNYEYIRETRGFKNIVLANRLSVNNNPNLPCHWVDLSEVQSFRSTTHIVRFLTTAIRELIGHGTGKLLSETKPGVYNFKENPPISPLNGKGVTSYYLSGQTWKSVFGNLAGTVEECRAILISEYLMDNKELLAVFGYTDSSEITAEDPLYTTYLNIGVDGLQALEHYNFENQTWGQVHHQACPFSILKHLLQEGGGVIQILFDLTTSTLTINIDRTKILSHGKPALASYLCRLHIWRCTADFTSCAEFSEPMCAVNGVYEQWRQIVCSKPEPRWKFVQPNTFVTDGDVNLKVYDESNEGIIQSWAERRI
ncbi:uncharacterized protein N7483_006379 [Penicillium malachiteum]|uniref:uncharacterized protein n=1 Tax=Penicillium malachiteum TaxID=1324776 RepID=UPI002549ADB6|nr:uncharacterized protein N7483_006379 [Penicillium malachiteum]KAJ5725022.1 hypothetical protein N7483_006379 [Penicillium malachiteum]